jgi:hypothetical protein
MLAEGPQFGGAGAWHTLYRTVTKQERNRKRAKSLAAQ